MTRETRPKSLLRRKAGGGDIRFGVTLNPKCDEPLEYGIHGREVLFCHRYLRRSPQQGFSDGLQPVTRVKMGLPITTQCWANVHWVRTETWSLRYAAVNSLQGWNYVVYHFGGDLEQFRRDIIMLRVTT